MTSTLSTAGMSRFAARARLRRRARMRLLFAIAGGVTAIALVAWLVLGSGALAVRHVDVTGAGSATAEVTAVARTAVGDPMLTVDTGALRSRIAAIPAVAHVEVSRAWPGTLHVVVTDRTPVAVVHTGATWQLVDRTGTAYATVALRPPGMLRLGLADPGPNDPATRAALAVLRVLPAKVRNRLLVISATSRDGVRLRLTRGVVVVWGGPEGSARKAAALAALLHRDASLYDVSTPGVVTTRR